MVVHQTNIPAPINDFNLMAEKFYANMETVNRVAQHLYKPVMLSSMQMKLSLAVQMPANFGLDSPNVDSGPVRQGAQGLEGWRVMLYRPVSAENSSFVL